MTGLELYALVTVVLCAVAVLSGHRDNHWLVLAALWWPVTLLVVVAALLLDRETPRG